MFDEITYLDWISGRRVGWIATVARGGLSCLTPFYRAAIGLRNLSYHYGWGVQRAGLPVVSVGNLTTGGTGKTPFVAWLVQRLQELGKRPAIVSRGYRHQGAGGNDELRLLEQLVPGVPHQQDPDRVAAAKQLQAKNCCDLIVLDDGFQHRRLHRDLDIVLIDALNPWGFGRLLPRGLLREPPTSLGRAQLVIVTRSDQVSETTKRRLIEEIQRRTSAPVCTVSFPQTAWINARRETRAIAEISAQSLAFCGIGSPEGFRRTLIAAGQQTAADELLAFRDHCDYGPHDRQRLEHAIRSHNPAQLLTTRKDLVKFSEECLGQIPLWAADVQLRFESGREECDALLRTLAAASNKR